MDAGRPTPRRERWFIAAFWAAFAAFYTAQSYAVRRSVGRPVSLRELLPGELLYVGLWALLTPLILRLARRLPVDQRNWPRRVPLHLVFALAIAVAQRIVYDGILLLVGSGDAGVEWNRLFRSVLSYFDYGLFLYAIVLLIGHALVYYERFRSERALARRLEADLTAARLATLQMQLHPHFLFNTLNSISVLVRRDPQGAERMVGRLAAFLRATLDGRDARLVPLRRELEVLSTYLDIERVRFGERLRVLEDIDPAALDAEVPFLLLQPLVENALRHGIGRSPGPGWIRIRAAADGRTLELQVANGRGAESGAMPREIRALGAPEAAAPPEPRAGSGLGLANTRARLVELFGDGARCELVAAEDGGAMVTLRFPLRAAPVPAAAAGGDG